MEAKVEEEEEEEVRPQPSAYPSVLLLCMSTLPGGYDIQKYVLPNYFTSGLLVNVFSPFLTMC